MSTTNLSEKKPHLLLQEAIQELKSIDSSLTRLEEMLYDLEKKYIEVDDVIESLKKQIK